MSSIRVGIIGVAALQTAHITRLQESPDAEIVGLVDTDPNRLTAAVEKHPELADVPKYDDYKKCLLLVG